MRWHGSRWRRWIVLPAVLGALAVGCGEGAPSGGDAQMPALLVAHAQGIELRTSTGDVTFLEGRPVEVAVPDLRGGVVFQGTPPATDTWPPVAAPIEHVAAPGVAPTVLVDGDGAYLLTVVQVAAIDDRPTLVYRAWAELPGDCAEDHWECRWAHQEEHLIVRDLATGAERDLATVGSFESDDVRVVVGGAWAALAINHYGEEDPPCVGWFPADRLLDPPEGRIAAAGGLAPFCTRDVMADCPAGRRCSGVTRLALAPDGARLAYTVVGSWTDDATGEGDRLPSTLTVLDPASGATEFHVEVGGPGSRVRWLDVGDAWVVLGRDEGSDAGDPEATKAVMVAVDRGGQTTVQAVDERAALWAGPVPGSG